MIFFTKKQKGKPNLDEREHALAEHLLLVLLGSRCKHARCQRLLGSKGGEKIIEETKGMLISMDTWP